MAGIKSHPTPNPDSLKFTRNKPFIESGMESFASVDEARSHLLGRPLMEIDGVVNVFILPQFVTVTKDPGARWNDVTPKVRSVLETR
jgi:scaffold Nfu/NifU family protein